MSVNLEFVKASLAIVVTFNGKFNTLIFEFWKVLAPILVNFESGWKLRVPVAPLNAASPIVSKPLGNDHTPCELSKAELF